MSDHEDSRADLQDEDKALLKELKHVMDDVRGRIPALVEALAELKTYGEVSNDDVKRNDSKQQELERVKGLARKRASTDAIFLDRVKRRRTIESAQT
ncbi:hypothetical protein HDU96_000216, partial [Phlyctochytrium bullatum]